MLYINNQTDDTPEIIFDPLTTTLSFKGNSYPENCELVYLPVIEFLNNFDVEKHKVINLNFHFNLINSTSVVYVAQMFSRLASLSTKDLTINVTWCFDEFDEELKELGERYNSLASE